MSEVLYQSIMYLYIYIHKQDYYIHHIIDAVEMGEVM